MTLSKETNHSMSAMRKRVHIIYEKSCYFVCEYNMESLYSNETSFNVNNNSKSMKNSSKYD